MGWLTPVHSNSKRTTQQLASRRCLPDTTKLARSPRKTPRQFRSQATVEAILGAATRIFLHRGFSRATTNAIAELAGVSVGSLYQYFPNKTALLGALKERHIVECMTKLTATCRRSEGLPFADAVRAVIAENARHFAEHGPLVRIFQEQLPHQDVGERERAAMDEFTAVLRGFFTTHRHLIRVENLEDALFFARAMGGHVMKAAVCDRFEDVRNGTITNELTAALLLYLTGSASGTTGRANAS